MFSTACNSQREAFPNLAGYYPDVINDKLGNEVSYHSVTEAGSLMGSATASVVLFFLKKCINYRKRKNTQMLLHTVTNVVYLEAQ